MEGGGWRVEGGQCILGGGSKDGGWKGGDEGWTVYSGWMIRRDGGWGGGVFLLEVQYSVLKSLISTCVLSYEGSREDWLLDRICESKKDCWDSIRRTSYPYQ